MKVKSKEVVQLGKEKFSDEEIKNHFIQVLLSMDVEQMTDFIKNKGKEPKKIKPFICLYNQQ